MKRKSTVGLVPNRTGNLFGNDNVVLQKVLHHDSKRAKEENRDGKKTSPHLPGVKLYRAENPIDSSSPSAKNLIHRNLPLDFITGGFCCPQKRPIIGENPKGPSRTSI